MTPHDDLATLPLPQTSSVGNVGIDVRTCINCFRPACSFSLRTPLDWTSPPEARGKWWECECGHEWPGWEKPLFFDVGDSA